MSIAAQLAKGQLGAGGPCSSELSVCLLFRPLRWMAGFYFVREPLLEKWLLPPSLDNGEEL